MGLKRIPQNYLVFIGLVVLLAVIVAVFAQFSTEGMISKEPERIHLTKFGSSGFVTEENDFVKVSDMPSNSHGFFYYPDTKDTNNRDVYQLFQLIRLPLFLGGGEDELSAYRAYSVIDLTSHCVTKYWPEENRMRIEDPCSGNVYNPLNGALMIGGSVLVEKNSALPHLELAVDENGYILVKTPVWTKQENGAIGIGREISSQEKEEYQRIVENYENTIKEKLRSVELPDTLPTGHEFYHLYDYELNGWTSEYRNGNDKVQVLYEWCNCTKSANQIKAEEPRAHNQMFSLDEVPVYSYPNHVDVVSGNHNDYIFIFYKDGYRFKVKTDMDFATGSNLMKSVFFSQ